MALQDTIIQQAAKLFLEKGLKAVSMDDIAKSLGISKRTLYENFASKDELLSECLLEMIDRREKEVELACRGCTDTIDIMVVAAADLIKGMNVISPLFVKDIALYHFRMANDLYSKYKDKRRESMLNLLRRGKAEGYILQSVNEELVSEVLTSNEKSIMGIFSSGKYSYQSVFSHTILSYLRGLATQKGIRRMDEKFQELKRESGEIKDQQN